MKAILIICLLALAFGRESINIKASQAVKLGPSNSDVYQVIQGLLEGFPTEAHISEIMECVNGVDKISENLSKAITALKAQSAESSVEGLKDLAEAINQIPKFIAECNPVERDLTRFYHSINVFRSPLTFNFVAKQILTLNGVEIFWYVDQAVKFFDAQRYKDFGFYIGTALGKVCGSGITVIGY